MTHTKENKVREIFWE